MQFFSQDYVDFFRELEENNNKVWFDANKKRYENSVKKPFYAFTEAIINLIKVDEPDINSEPKNSIFRINRDVRFSADKTPYKIMCSAVVSKYGRKNMTAPGIYFEVSANEVNIYGGIYMPEKEHLQVIREYIADHLNEFQAAYKNENFVKHYEKILGEQNKKIKGELADFIEKEPLILNKQFYYISKIDGKHITSNNLAELLMEKYYAGKSVQSFLMRAIGEAL